MSRITKPYTAKSRPIIFNAEMVRAILEGRKTQTRRVIKIDPEYVDSTVEIEENKFRIYKKRDNLYFGCDILDSPYGKPSDFFWVKESFRAVNEHGGDEWTTYAYPRYKDGQLGPIAALEEDYFYKKSKWQSPIFMPRWASRISLRIVEIRVERVQDIPLQDLRAEGVVFSHKCGQNVFEAYKRGFVKLWNSINAKKGYGWDENSWVWIIEFERIGDE